ncbi:hypothetical protein WS68_12850 [Burkholderia sp. TSV86]|nr:hypothetical protein WS68_12850 [Burkholderia sp. TSV86]
MPRRLVSLLLGRLLDVAAFFAAAPAFAPSLALAAQRIRRFRAVAVPPFVRPCALPSAPRSLVIAFAAPYTPA